ncbi:MAG: MOSC domain-containing protein [Candidatus Krumholzibacteriota bacterium]|nr:MOSC domain-containing protein [Candidatus Krumholzibacteriota bacterium]
MKGTFTVVSVNISREKGEPKIPAGEIVLLEGHGIEGDAHAGDWHRQVSLLAEEDIAFMKEKLDTLGPGDFAENITTRGVDLAALPVGTVLCIGDVCLEVTQIGKECHSGCAILEQTGECIMPKRGIFAKVLKGGVIRDEDTGTYDI